MIYTWKIDWIAPNHTLRKEIVKNNETKHCAQYILYSNVYLQIYLCIYSSISISTRITGINGTRATVLYSISFPLSLEREPNRYTLALSF